MGRRRKKSGIKIRSMHVDLLQRSADKKTNTQPDYKMVEAAVADEKQAQKERGMTRDLLEQLQKRREEEDEARGLIE